jgi:hypothetical protein
MLGEMDEEAASKRLGYRFSPGPLPDLGKGEVDTRGLFPVEQGNDYPHLIRNPH